MIRGNHIPVGWRAVKIKDVAQINPRSDMIEDNTLVSFISMSSVSEIGYIIVSAQTEAFKFKVVLPRLKMAIEQMTSILGRFMVKQLEDR